MAASFFRPCRTCRPTHPLKSVRSSLGWEPLPIVRRSLPRGAFPENQPGGLARVAGQEARIPLRTGRISELRRRSLLEGAYFCSSSEVCLRKLHARGAPCMKILVIDDHVLIREAMRGVLRELKGEAAVILEASDSRQAMRLIQQ